MFKLYKQIKTKKCQPAADDTLDLIQTKCVTDSRLARQQTKQKNRTGRKKV